MPRRLTPTSRAIRRCVVGAMGGASLLATLGCQQAHVDQVAGATCLSNLSTLAPIMGSGGPPRTCAPAAREPSASRPERLAAVR